MEMINETPEQKAQLALLKSTALSLRERGEFDTVHIFVTKHSFRDDLTNSIEIGVGNQFARQKQIEEYIERVNAPMPPFFMIPPSEEDEE